ncbi:Response regulator receiver domain-containing protein [Pseudoxanthomonas sp. GM95]|uniref:response regulator n=1 Tax=Pseudoxanthomonas sp. GM95 TaxID=1881043 RepID=UPI0008C7D7F4|nr:response regulator [Pseudoxanthomonas sp. GM95]SEL61997.1 Response regulator receiver domain-containing protein [Pseudoxanthomonas sp. GM95]
MSSASMPVILIVEDDSGAREIAAMILEAEGYAVVEASGGMQALDLLASNTDVSLIFSDINMPGGMDGIQLARRIGDLNAQLPVVLTSGHAQNSFRDFPGNAAFLAKPYNRQALLGAMRQHLPN